MRYRKFKKGTIFKLIRPIDWCLFLEGFRINRVNSQLLFYKLFIDQFRIATCTYTGRVTIKHLRATFPSEAVAAKFADLEKFSLVHLDLENFFFFRLLYK